MIYWRYPPSTLLFAADDVPYHTRVENTALVHLFLLELIQRARGW